MGGWMGLLLSDWIEIDERVRVGWVGGVWVGGLCVSLWREGWRPRGKGSREGLLCAPVHVKWVGWVGGWVGGWVAKALWEGRASKKRGGG